MFDLLLHGDGFTPPALIITHHTLPPVMLQVGPVQTSELASACSQRFCQPELT